MAIAPATIPLADHKGLQDRAEGAAGPAGAVLDRAVRALSALGEALVAALAEMYVQGVSTRKVKQVTEELVGHAFSASAISAINKRLDGSLKAFCELKLKEPFPYLILVRAMSECARTASSRARRY